MSACTSESAPPQATSAAGGRWANAAIYDTTIAHVRHTPVRNAFRYRSYSWLVDLDALPRPPRPLRALAQFRAQDHLGEPDRTLRQNVEAFLWLHDIDLRGGRIQMLANARVLGYVFNPLSVYWCHDGSGVLVAVIAEVHNTYGERHAYLLRPGADSPQGRHELAKEFYVSPFYPVDGSYVMSLPEPDEQVRITIELHRGENKPFVATVRGRRRTAGTGALLRSAARIPWVTLTVAAQIRVQGIKLWARRVPVVSRPHHPRQPGV
ncbi:MAG: DUF1365 domain-containing protein [Sporichthya sp.]|nr:DUF1365 domain-containing protein [Sporichthya sp.]MBA3744785.1 DUF1365 domain-containing protein [Sporichthya sp.]